MATPSALKTYLTGLQAVVRRIFIIFKMKGAINVYYIAVMFGWGYWVLSIEYWVLGIRY